MKSLLLFLLLTFQMILSAQDAFLQWTDERHFDGSSEYNHFVGIQGPYLFVVSSSNASPVTSLNVHLNVFDRNSLEFRQGIEIIHNKSESSFESVVISSAQINVFTSYYDRNLGIKVLNVQRYNTDGNSLSETRRVDEVTQKDKNDYLPFYVTTSPNGKYILIHHPTPNVTGYAAFNLKVVNEDFKLTWEKEIDLNYKERMVTYQDLVIDDATTVYLMTSINPYGIKRTSGFGTLLNLKNTLFTYRPFKDLLNEYEFALTRNWIQGVKMG